jgi:hypothetical protein
MTMLRLLRRIPTSLLVCCGCWEPTWLRSGDVPLCEICIQRETQYDRFDLTPKGLAAIA